MASPFNVQEYIIQAAHIREFPQALANSQEDVLWLHVKQYTPKDNPNPQKGDLTVIGAHANGFPKELYEPLWDEFYHESKKQGFRIRSIWTFDAAWQGQSGILNRDMLGNDPGWLDYARDVIHTINTFRMPRPILGIGHSFGANVLTNAALLHPRLFSGLVLLDPTIMQYIHKASPEAGPGFQDIAVLSSLRRDRWPSRAVARQSFAKSPFYQSWDPRALDLWVQWGLVGAEDAAHGQKGNEDDGAVVLATTKHQEVFTYMRPSWHAFDAKGQTLIKPLAIPDTDVPSYPVYRAEGLNTFNRLPNLRPGALFVFGGTSPVTSYLADGHTDATGTGIGGSGGPGAGRVSQFVSPGHGHLVPMEAPALCARKAAEFARDELERWWVDERQYQEWTKKSREDKTMISDLWRDYMNAHKRKGAAKI